MELPTGHSIELTPDQIERLRNMSREGHAQIVAMEKTIKAMKVQWETNNEWLSDLLVKTDAMTCSWCKVRLTKSNARPPGNGYSNWHCGPCRTAHDCY